jgi:hypothetical protein
MMSKTSMLLAAALAAGLAFTPVAHANDAKSAAKETTVQETEKEADRHEPAEGTQQHKMKTCNAEAHDRGLKGDERRAFMSSCLRK